MSLEPPKNPPPWAMPADLKTIVAEDGEWEDPSWDPILLTVIGDTRHEGRVIKIAWQLSLWPGDLFFTTLNPVLHAQIGKADGHAWSHLLLDEIESRNPILFAKLHDDSDAATCVIWVEDEADGKALMTSVWLFLHTFKAEHERH